MPKLIVSPSDRKWVFYTSIILWCIMTPLVFNTIITFIIAQRVLFILHSPIPLVLLTLPLPLASVLEWIKKPETRIRSLIHILLLTIVFTTAWTLNFTYSLLETSELVNILFFTLIFSTAFAVIVVPLTLHLYRRRNKAFIYNKE